jgi:hypothetical protein
MTVFQDAASYSLVETAQCFKGACCLHNQSDEGSRSISIRPHGTIFGKTVSYLHTRHVRNWNLAKIRILIPSALFLPTSYVRLPDST